VKSVTRLLLASVVGLSLASTVQPPVQAQVVAERRTEARLNEPISVNYQAVPLRLVIDDLRSRTGLNFDVRWQRLEAAGVSPDTPIELELRHVPAGVVLRRVLQHAGSEFDPIGYSIEGAIVTTSTQRDLDRRIVTRVYDVRGLLMPIRDFNNAPQLDVNATLNAIGPGPGGGGNDLFADDNDEQPAETRADRVQKLIDLIREMVTDRNDA